MAFNGLAAQLRDAEQRRAERVSVFLKTMLHVASGPPIAADLVNISRLGFMARTPALLPVGTPIAIVLPQIGPAGARVAWSLGGRVGGEFTRAIEGATYVSLLAALPRGA